MAPKTWATDAQTLLLTDFIPLYETYQSTTKRYQPFWDRLNAAFLDQWPILPPGTSPNDLDETEFKEYSDDLAKLYARIKEWYRWRCNTRSRTTSTTVSTKEMKKIYYSGTRNSKEYEVFVKLNPEIFTPEFKAECLRREAKGRDKLAVWHKVAVKLWESATPEQKAGVQAWIAVQKEVEEDPDPRTPSDYQKSWEKLPAVLSKTVTPAVRKAGVLAFVTIVGPVPDAGGQILATTLQFGDKEETPLFAETWADHDTVLVDQLASFAGRYEFPPDVCAKRSLLCTKAEESTSTSDQDVEAEDANASDKSGGADGSSGGSSGGPPGASSGGSLSGGASSSGASSSSALSGGASNDGASSGGALNDGASSGGASTDGASSYSSDLSSESHPITGTNEDFQASTVAANNSPPITQSSEPAAPIAIAGNGMIDFNDLGPNAFSDLAGWELDDSRWADPEILDAIMRMNAPDTDTSLASVLPANSVTHVDTRNAPPTFDTPPTIFQAQANQVSPVAHTPDPNTSALQISGITPTALNLVSATVPATPYTPISLGSAPAPPVACSTGLHMLTSDQLSLPIQPPTVPTTIGVSAPDRSGGFTFRFPPLTTNSGISHPQNQRTQPPTNENIPPNPQGINVFGLISDTHAPASNTSKTLISNTQAPPSGGTFGATSHGPLHNMDNGIRRSNRAPIPSTRLDKLNEIGTNTVPPKPPTESPPDVAPPWFLPAHNHLQRDNLGPAWSGLVESWAGYERMKGWKSGKGLPAKGRPEEWHQWSSKNRHGARNYQILPAIDDPAELGIAITGWVNSFAPSDFARTGPHGMVSLLTLMVWWGVAALTPSSWNDNSRPQWDALVQDLLCRYGQLLNTSPSAAKRPREDDVMSQRLEEKRARTDLVTVPL